MGQIGIEEQCPVDQTATGLELSADPGQRKAGRAQSDGVVFAQIHGPPSQSHGLGGFRLVVARPAIGGSPVVAPCRKGIGGRELRIDLDGLVEQTQGVAVGFLGLAIDGRHPAQVVERNCADDARRYLGLQIEDAAEGAVEAVGRKVRARRRMTSRAVMRTRSLAFCRLPSRT